MNLTVSKTTTIVRIAVVDTLLLVAVCLIPALSHLLSLPLYMMNPMLLCLMAGMLLVNDRRNAYLLAVALPLLSMLVSGMPEPAKAVCMVAELTAIVGVSHFLESKMPVMMSMIVAIVAGKVVYYLLKALIIAPAVLFGTSIVLQIVVALVYAVAFALLRKR